MRLKTDELCLDITVIMITIHIITIKLLLITIKYYYYELVVLLLLLLLFSIVIRIFGTLPFGRGASVDDVTCMGKKARYMTPFCALRVMMELGMLTVRSLVAKNICVRYAS